MSQINTLLSLLEGVRKTGPHSWLARCPAHDDKRPSLSLRNTENSTSLVHCHAGCSVHEVVRAVGLDISDLFPSRQHHGKPERRPFPAMDALRAIAFEALVVASAGTTLLAGQPLTPTNRERLMLAVERIQSAVSTVMPTMKGARHA